MREKNEYFEVTTDGLFNGPCAVYVKSNTKEEAINIALVKLNEEWEGILEGYENKEFTIHAVTILNDTNSYLTYE
ncbi:hypothetical protein [Rummeliibacillus stabekisii]|uniref:Uncharacterized protein n=1 Tax=Rummeliibacillus stabekisii TaxID=241244 RepID=A0A143HC61_9BACL|nr:hypothetical protein [Rummeliibacillus stabekisii]AMW99323.1 hypothetical protein ATY39_07510 [Rummeliibacillus stabekisii]